ncbi:MAG: 2-amino-4-hydroxy-6-hydroxymethyldihydropteridine diphosphokinase [Roseburia sp.]
MDCIRIKNLELYARHGVYAEETKLGQKFLVDAELFLDCREAGQKDDLACSVNYGEVSHFITGFLTDHTYQLIEAAAEQTARALLLQFPLVEKLRLAVHKPWAPIGLPLEDVSVEITRSWHTAYVALGSNMGDREAYIRQAIQSLDELEDCRVEQVSSLIETEPYGMTEQDRFLNGALRLRTLYTPHELLDQLHLIEKAAGRERKVHWGPRTLDLDIIFYDELVMADKTLTIPHPDMQNRIFVLEPLKELCPYYRHPILQRTVTQLADERMRGESF